MQVKYECPKCKSKTIFIKGPTLDQEKYKKELPNGCCCIYCDKLMEVVD